MSDISTIQTHLEGRFADQRIVVWHDLAGEYTDSLAALALSDVETLIVANDEYAIKYKVLVEAPEAKFLIYRPSAGEAGATNWLWDIELAQGIFTADRTALLTQDLGLADSAVAEEVSAHRTFFRAGKRTQALKELIVADDDAAKVKAKMCAVLLGQREHSMSEITRTLLVDAAKDSDAKFKALEEYELDAFYWEGVGKIYGYRSDSPTVADFVLWIFRKAIDGFSPDSQRTYQEIRLDFGGFRNHRSSQAALLTLAKRTSESLNYASTIENSSFRDFLGNDLFPENEQRIIIDLALAIEQQSAPVREVLEVVRSRQNSLWAEEYVYMYGALSAAAEFLALTQGLDLTMSSFDEGLQSYTKAWYRADQLYRQFTYSYRQAEHSTPLESLRQLVENRYTNQYVYNLGVAWQQQVDAIDQWRSGELRNQTRFFDTYVEPVITDRDKKVVVIISDAFRYEAAEELGSRIRQEDRYDASLEAMLGVLPSYTKLGMAALLPHKQLEYSPKADAVLADGQSTTGTENRGKILNTVGGSAIQAEDFKALTAEGRRDLFKANRVLYIYHNVIDKTGDDKTSERRVFVAVEEAFSELLDLVKKATSANASNILITADHGFLFQDEELADAYMLSEQSQGDQLLAVNRRYTVGQGLKRTEAFATFTSDQVGLKEGMEIQVPKSIHRIRTTGGGTRFVHGGAALQEIVVPVLIINKKRKSDLRPVNVEIFPETDKITTGQIVVKLHQTEPVSDKVQPRSLRAGIYIGEVLLSNQVLMTFDQISTDARDRYQEAHLYLGPAAEEFNGQSVEFRLEEKVDNTNHWKVMSKVPYALKRSFTSDFDF
jgi:uncharacterized protein (TIGR02687 family)